VFTGKVEVGQNIRTSLSQAVAEELRVPTSQIKLVMGDTLLTAYDMGTFGSRTTPTMNLQLRKAAAAACDMLKDLAAQTWNVPRGNLVAADGKISDPVSKNSAIYGDLLKKRELAQLIPDRDPLLPATEWKIAGKPLSKIDGRDFVTGAHKYPSDQKRPGMLYGKVVRPSKFEAKLASVDTAAAEKCRRHRRAGWRLHRRRCTERRNSPHTQRRNQVGLERRAPAVQQERVRIFAKHPEARESSDASPNAPSPANAISATYTVAYIAHAPLEPRTRSQNGTATKLTVWTGTQRPFGVREELAAAFHIPQESVHVLMPDTGSGYGGKHTGETAIEAPVSLAPPKSPSKSFGHAKKNLLGLTSAQPAS